MTVPYPQGFTLGCVILPFQGWLVLDSRSSGYSPTFRRRSTRIVIRHPAKKRQHPKQARRTSRMTCTGDAR